MVTEKATSINQNSTPISLPNFCNLGAMLRVLLLVNGISVAGALLKSQSLGAWRDEFVLMSAVVQPAVLLSLVLLCLTRRWLQALHYPVGVLLLLLGELLVVTLLHHLKSLWVDPMAGYSLWHYWAFALIVTGTVLGYFNLRSRALSPAIAESRLQALQARIRPHFLFNSMNAVLSLIRSDPRRAERALEDMAALFRVLMADNRKLTSLQQEVDLTKQYLEIEQLRLGERLQVVWHLDNMPADALIPPLVLQPLLENAVYHGIEPMSSPGEVHINIYLNRKQLLIVLRNPYHGEGSHHGGNKMAVNNIRERLALHFDAEASLKSQVTANTYQVSIAMPYIQAAP